MVLVFFPLSSVFLIERFSGWYNRGDVRVGDDTDMYVRANSSFMDSETCTY